MSIAFGVVLLARPGVGALTLALLYGLFALTYGVTQIGKMPEMVKAGVNVSIGIDGNNASNYSDMMRATYLVAGLFKDARRDPTIFPAEQAFEMATNSKRNEISEP